MVHQFKSFIIILISLIILASCASTEKSKTILTEKISPNSCRITGTIISTEMTNNSSGPCAKHPCLASVKINNVIGTGFSFKPALIKGDTIKVYFEFTLSKTTKEDFPQLKKSFPGLKVGGKFIGDIEKIELLQLNKRNKKIEYKIFNYDIIEK